MTWVKICGMTNLEDALVAVDAGADAVGFVFYEKSPRCVTVETARVIVAGLPESVEKIGVFVNPEADPIRVMVDAGLTERSRTFRRKVLQEVRGVSRRLGGRACLHSSGLLSPSR